MQYPEIISNVKSRLDFLKYIDEIEILTGAGLAILCVRLSQTKWTLLKVQLVKKLEKHRAEFHAQEPLIRNHELRKYNDECSRFMSVRNILGLGQKPPGEKMNVNFII